MSAVERPGASDDTHVTDVTDVTVRYWAALRAAAGTPSDQVAPGPLDQVLAAVSSAHAGTARFAQVLAISPQSVESHDAFSSDQGGFAFPLLADTDKAVGKQYGILGPVGFYRRSIFVVDRMSSRSRFRMMG